MSGETPDKTRKPFGALAMLAVVILAIFVKQRHSDIIVDEASRSSQDFVDTYTVGVSSKRFNDEGKQSRLLEAEYAAHYSVSDETLLQAPKIQSISDTGKIWETSARSGKVRPGGDVYDLWNTVLIERIQGDTVARTDKLTYDALQGQATTQEEVIIDTRIGQTVGIGMTASLNKEVLKLHSEVRSVFEPPR
ncbi:MAG: LPS export ABC transporter periplasmic protein LptC [Pseudomonadota bacterium]